MNTLSATVLSKSYNNRRVLENFSLYAESGSIVGITGPNGSGKTTTLKLLAGILAPGKGSVEFSQGDKKFSGADITPHIAIVAPYLAMYEMMTAFEFVKFTCAVRGVQNVAYEALEKVGLKERADEHLKNYSSGMLQRVRFAAAEAVQAPILLFDEPTITLDEEGIRFFDRLVEESRAKEKIIIIATNDERDLVRCDRIIMLQ